MNKTDLLIVYPTDPLGPKIGGTEIFLRGFMKWAPDDIAIKFIGVSSDREKRPPGRWSILKIGSREVRFFPIFLEKDENRKRLIPLSLRFTAALGMMRIGPSADVILFNRIEPLLVFRNSKILKLAVVHTDVRKHILKEESEVFWSNFPWLYFMLESAVLRYAEHVYTVSKSSLEFYSLRYPELIQKLSFLPTWADAELFNAVDGPKTSFRKMVCGRCKGLSSSGKWILFVGRLQKVKAPIRSIDAFYEYRKNDRSASLIMIGDGNLRRDIGEYISRLNIESNVFLQGSMDQEALALFYRASDVLLLTSNFEGMPRSAIEALSCGLPVVSTDVGEVRSVVKNGFSGEVAEGFSPEAVRRAIEKVLANPANYSKENCIDAVSGYKPQAVLKPLYERIRSLGEKKRCRESGRVNICGICVDNMTMDEVVNTIERFIADGGKEFIVTSNVDHIVKLQRDGEFMGLYKEASLVLPDGMPLLWAAAFLGTPLKEKISGSDIFSKICEASARKGHKLFFLGGRPGSADKAARELRKAYPDIRIAGIYSPPFGFEEDSEENRKIVNMIRESKANILFVGLGAPKQEKWIYKHYKELNVSVSIGIGATFEFISGVVRRAPVWMQKVGLEWFWRLIMEPRRLWRRYLVDDMRFFRMVLRQKLSDKGKRV